MLLPIALFWALHFFAGQGFAEVSTAPKSVHVKDVLRKLSSRETLALMGRDRLVDSSVSTLKDPSIKWHERYLDSILGRHRATLPRVIQMTFAPVNFEGIPAKVTIFFADDSSFGATVSSPYPLRLGSRATLEDFNLVSKNIAKSLGEPSVSTGNYIDYMVNGLQSLFGSLKNGTITINLWRLGP
jgi:hypothetical protein